MLIKAKKRKFHRESNDKKTFITINYFGMAHVCVKRNLPIDGIIFIHILKGRTLYT